MGVVRAAVVGAGKPGRRAPASARERRRWRRPRRRRWRRRRLLHSCMSCRLPCQSMQDMQRIRNHFGIGGRGVESGRRRGLRWRQLVRRGSGGVPVPAVAVQLVQELHQYQVCSTCCVGVLCRRGFVWKPSASALALALQQLRFCVSRRRSSAGRNRVRAQTQEDLNIKSSSREALLGRLHQTSGVRETRVRGGAAIWPSLAAMARCGGGVRECNLAARVGRLRALSRGVGGRTCHWPRA